MKCERDWQGPSDDECEDDLLVVTCQKITPDHGVHVGVVLENHPGGTAQFGVIVQWVSGTAELRRYSDGSVYRRQFK